MNFTWELSDYGKEAINDQILWYEQNVYPDGDQLADRWFTEISDAFAVIAKAPMRFGFAPENGKWLPELQIRQMLFRPWKSGVGWRVLFAVDEDAKLVTILQVRHEHRLWMHEGDEG
jgi:plasmid stabilization system protein ParE